MTKEFEVEGFEECWKIQEQFTEYAYEYLHNMNIHELSMRDRIKITEKYTLKISREIFEALDLLDWKDHRKEQNDFFNISNLQEELIDVQKYLWGLMIIWGFNPESFIEEFKDKSKIVKHRFYQEHEIGLVLESDKKICAVDIDGILSDYPKCFIDWVNENGNLDFKIETMKDFRREPKKLLEMKHLYRVSRTKRNLPVKNNVVNAMKKLKNEGYHIIILTTRPAKKYSKLYIDTLVWLENNRIPFDYLKFVEEEKFATIIHDFSIIKFMIEDEEDNIRKIRRAGIKVYTSLEDAIKGEKIE